LGLTLELAGAVPAAGAERVAEILAAMKAAGERLQTMAARFEQKKHDHVLDEYEVAAGKLYLRVPGNLRWEYDPPDGKILLVQEDRVRVYNPTARQVQEFKKGQMRGFEGDLLIGFGRSNRELAQRYEVSLAEEGPRGVVLRLKPRSEEALFISVELTLDPHNWVPVRTVFTEPNDDRTELTFSERALNGDLPGSVFELDLPPGVEVVRE
jgi:outer membrane lipoprotein carrier protein